MLPVRYADQLATIRASPTRSRIVLSTGPRARRAITFPRLFVTRENNCSRDFPSAHTLAARAHLGLTSSATCYILALSLSVLISSRRFRLRLPDIPTRCSYL